MDRNDNSYIMDKNDNTSLTIVTYLKLNNYWFFL